MDRLCWLGRCRTGSSLTAQVAGLECAMLTSVRAAPDSAEARRPVRVLSVEPEFERRLPCVAVTVMGSAHREACLLKGATHQGRT